MVIGPGVGCLLISAGGVKLAYGGDAISCAPMVMGVLAIRPQPPLLGDSDPIVGIRGSIALGIRGSIAHGLSFVRRNRALLGSFPIDLNAMVFGMPRALFPVLAVSVYHAG